MKLVTMKIWEGETWTQHKIHNIIQIHSAEKLNILLYIG